MTQTALASHADIHPMQVSQVSKALEVKGMVTRMRSAVDERAKQIAMTPSGIAALRRSMPLVIEVQQRLFGEQGKDGGALLRSLLAIEQQEES